MKKYNFRITIEKDEDGFFIAKCPSLQGCHTQGRTYEEAVKRMQEAIALYIEVLKKKHQMKSLTQITKPTFFALQDMSVVL